MKQCVLHQYYFYACILLSCCLASGSGSNPRLALLERAGSKARLDSRFSGEKQRHLHYPSVYQQDDESAEVEGDRRRQFICSVTGGLDVARLSSSVTQLAFRSALEDVEFIRHYISEAALNNNDILSKALGRNQGSDSVKTAVGMTLEELSQTLDVEARNITSSNATTLTAGLGYSDDRRDRRVERYVGLANEPIVGTKQTDLDLIEPVADIFPWLVDRTGSEESNRLYAAAWIGTHGEAWMYYPTFKSTYGYPFGPGDVLGDSYNSKEEEFVKPNLPPKSIEKAYLTQPYPDTAIPGLSLITAQAPVYFTGTFQGYEYNQTYIASTGVDISVERMTTFLDDLDGTVSENSFAILVSFDGFHSILISQSTVEKIYPEYTGMEESRVTYDATDGSITSDRRNQTYRVSDTIFQPLTNLSNSPDWKTLESKVQKLEPGERSFTLIDVTLTGEETPTKFYVIYERWDRVADWVLLLFVPQEELESSVAVDIVRPKLGNDLNIHIFTKGEVEGSGNNGHFDIRIDEGALTQYSNSTSIETIFRNAGVLDVVLAITELPAWLELQSQDGHGEFVVPSGQDITLTYSFLPEKLPGGIVRSISSVIAVTIRDKNYGNCFYKQVLTTNVFVDVYREPDLNQIGRTRAYGFTLCAVVTISALAWSAWVFSNATHRVVKASQPLFLQMMCAGILVMGLSLIPLSIDDSLASVEGSSVACMAFPWFLSIGFSITFSALFSKVWRLNQIVHGARNHKRVYISTRDVILPFLVICTLNVIILSIWSAVDPLIWVREPTDEAIYVRDGSIRSEETYGYCSLNDSALGLTCLVVLFLLNFGALVMASIQLYRARELSTEYCEGKFIAIAMGSMIQVFITGLPILAIVTDNPRVSYFVKSTIVFTLSMSLLLLTFLPKFFMATSGNKFDAPSTQLSTGASGSVKLVGLCTRDAERPVPPDNVEGKEHNSKEKFASVAEDNKTNSEHSGLTRSSNGFPEPHLEAKIAISDITMSIAMSEFEVPEQSMAQKGGRKATVDASKNAPPIPVRFPSITEDISNENGVSGRPMTGDSDRNRKMLSTGNIPKIPLRFPSVMEDTIDECDSLENQIVDDDAPEGTLAASNSAPKIPVRLSSVNEDLTREFCDESVEGDGIFSHESFHINHTHSQSASQHVAAENDGRNHCKSTTEGLLTRQSGSNENFANAAVPRRLPSLVEASDNNDIHREYGNMIYDII